jgi:hypothetical protein
MGKFFKIRREPDNLKQDQEGTLERIKKSFRIIDLVEKNFSSERSIEDDFMSKDRETNYLKDLKDGISKLSSPSSISDHLSSSQRKSTGL